MKKLFLFASIITAAPLFSMSELNEEAKRKARREMAFIAAAHGKTEWILALAEGIRFQNLPFESAHETGATPFYIACQEGHSKTVAALLDLNPHKTRGTEHLTLKSQNGETLSITPLHIAAAKGHSETICTLLANTTQENLLKLMNGRAEYINTQDAFKKRTPLHYATANGHLRAIATLLDFNADIFRQDDDGHTPLSLATQHPNPEVLKQFKDSTSLIKVIEKHDEHALKMLIDAKFDLEEQGAHGKTPLLVAIEYDNLNMVQMLLDAGASIESKDKFNRSAFDYAQELLKSEERRNGSKIMQLLEDTKLWQNNIFEAMRLGSQYVLKLIKQVKFINAKTEIGSTALMAAAIHNDPVVCKALIEAGADINAINRRGAWGPGNHTALSLAANLGRLEIVKIILAAKPDKSCFPLALELAKKPGNDLYHHKKEIVQLIENAMKEAEDLSLIRAVKKGDLAEVEKLISEQVNLEKTDDAGATALIWAALKGHIKITACLLNAGANIHAQKKDGNTAKSCVEKLTSGITSADTCSELGQQRLKIKEMISFKISFEETYPGTPIHFDPIDAKSGKECDLEIAITTRATTPI